MARRTAFGLVIVALALRSERARDRTAPAVPAELPPEAADFTGRRQELRHLKRCHRRRRKSTVTLVYGPPGIGKSALVCRAAHRLSRHYPDGQLYVDLRGADAEPARPEEVLARFLRALGVPTTDTTGDLVELSAVFRTVTRRRRLLVVLDNAANAAQVRALLPTGGGCATLVTSRAYVEIGATDPLRLDVLPDTEAVALFARTWRHAESRRNDAAMVDVVRLCGGLPLALRIAASRLRLRPDWSVADFAARIGDQHRRLDELRLDDLAVRASFDLTYQQLAEPVARTFRAFGCYGGPAIAYETLALMIDVQPAEAARRLDVLCEAMLLQPAGASRYSGHDLLRIYAWELAHRPEHDAERITAVQRLASWYQTQAEHWSAQRIGYETPHPAGLDWFDGEWHGLVSAMEASAALGNHEVVWRTVEALNTTFRFRALWTPLRRLTELAVDAAAADGQPAALGTASRHLSHVLRHTGSTDEAIKLLQHAVELFEQADNPTEHVETLKNLGELYNILGRHTESMNAFTRAVELAVDCGELGQAASSLVQLGALYIRKGELDEALALFEAGEQMFQHIDDRSGLTWVQYYIAGAYGLLGRYEEACERLRSGLKDVTVREELSGQAWFLRALGRTASLQGDWPVAVEAFKQEVTVVRRMKVDTAGAEAELAAARRRTMMPRAAQHSGWL